MKVSITENIAASVVTLLAILFWLPYVRARVVKGDYTIRWYHFFFGVLLSPNVTHVVQIILCVFFPGPFLWNRPAPEDAITADAVPDYYEGHHNDAIPPTDDAEHGPARVLSNQANTGSSNEAEIEEKHIDSDRAASEKSPAPKKKVGLAEVDGPSIEGAWYVHFSKFREVYQY
jgi:sodium-dependent phosphate transporter